MNEEYMEDLLQWKQLRERKKLTTETQRTLRKHFTLEQRSEEPNRRPTQTILDTGRLQRLTDLADRDKTTKGTKDTKW